MNKTPLVTATVVLLLAACGLGEDASKVTV